MRKLILICSYKYIFKALGVARLCVCRCIQRRMKCALESSRLKCYFHMYSISLSLLYRRLYRLNLFQNYVIEIIKKSEDILAQISKFHENGELHTMYEVSDYYLSGILSQFSLTFQEFLLTYLHYCSTYPQEN